jgi:hypothetical protein
MAGTPCHRAVLAPPAELRHRFGERHVRLVAEPVAVAGVPDELLVPQHGTRPPRHRLREDRDDRAQPAPVHALAGGHRQVLDEVLGGRLDGGDPAQVADDETVPVEPADAPARVAPRHPGAVDELRPGVRVRAEGGDLLAYLLDPVCRLGSPAELGVLGVHPLEEVGCLVGIGGLVVELAEGGVAIAGGRVHSVSYWCGSVRRVGHNVRPRWATRMTPRRCRADGRARPGDAASTPDYAAARTRRRSRGGTGPGCRWS